MLVATVFYQQNSIELPIDNEGLIFYDFLQVYSARLVDYAMIRTDLH